MWSRAVRSVLMMSAMLGACAPDAELPVTPSLRYGQPVGGGGGETLTGNNLSNPVIFAEGYGLSGLQIATANLLSTGLRTPPTATYATLPDYFIDPDSPIETLANVGTVYCQKTGHTWMPRWDTGATSAVVDWGDNLGSVQFTANSVIRVETTLYAPGTMLGYKMYLFSGERRTEQQCTDLAEALFQPTVYSVAPHLRLFKVAASEAVPVAGQLPLIDLTIADGLAADGPGYYSAEVNVGGKVVYGYNLFAKKLPVADKKGWYMISFSLDPQVTIGTATVANGVTLTAVDASDVNAELTSATETRVWFEIKDSRDKGGPKEK